MKEIVLKQIKDAKRVHANDKLFIILSEDVVRELTFTPPITSLCGIDTKLVKGTKIFKIYELE